MKIEGIIQSWLTYDKYVNCGQYCLASIQSVIKLNFFLSLICLEAA